MTAAIFQRSSLAFCRSPIMLDLTNAAGSQRGQKCCAASALRAMWNPLVSRRRGLPLRSVRASAFSRLPRCECNRTAASRRCSAPITTAKVMRRHLRKFLHRDSALDCAASKVIDKGKQIAAHLLEASVGDITFAAGEFSIAGTDRRATLREVARLAHIPTNYPLELELGLQDSAVYDPPGFAWSNGAQACEVEIDRDTGEVGVIGY